MLGFGRVQVGLLLSLAASLLACADAGPEPGQVGLALVGPAGPGLPEDVAFLRVLTRVGSGAPELEVADVSTLRTIEGRRRLAIPGIPAESVVSVRVEGQRADGEVAYVGSVGPLTLAAGEQLRAQVALAPARQSQTVTSGPSPRFLHAATRLADGRVLISGGFGNLTGAACAPDVAAGSQCFHATALKDAWLFEPTQHAFHEVPTGMLEARAGHSLTLLPDGRALVAGGASEAVLVFDPALPAIPSFHPVNALLAPSTLATFELFEPDFAGTNARDPARGRFVGRADNPSQVGLLSAPRFMHGAADNPDVPAQVLLLGGVGGTASAQTAELFDLHLASGYGTTPTTGGLSTPRATPTALGLQAMGANAVWIFGGGRARSNQDLAERWSRPQGIDMFTPATDSAFPETSTVTGDTPHPEYAFPQVLAGRVGGRGHAFVSAAYPPYCGSVTTPVFAPLEVTGAQGSCTGQPDLRRCMLIEAATGVTQACQTLQAHLAGAAAELFDGTVLISGGLSDAGTEMSLSIERFELPEDALELQSQTALSLASPRALHTSTGLPEGGALSVGGLRFDMGAPTLAESAEYLRW